MYIPDLKCFRTAPKKEPVLAKDILEEKEKQMQKNAYEDIDKHWLEGAYNLLKETSPIQDSMYELNFDIIFNKQEIDNMSPNAWFTIIEPFMISELSARGHERHIIDKFLKYKTISKTTHTSDDEIVFTFTAKWSSEDK